MRKYQLRHTNKRTKKLGSDMVVGELAVVQSFGCPSPVNGHIVLRTFDGLVSLSDPSNTWIAEHVSFSVLVLGAGEEVTLTATGCESQESS